MSGSSLKMIARRWAAQRYVVLYRVTLRWQIIIIKKDETDFVWRRAMVFPVITGRIHNETTFKEARSQRAKENGSSHFFYLLFQRREEEELKREREKKKWNESSEGESKIWSWMLNTASVSCLIFGVLSNRMVSSPHLLHCLLMTGN